MPKKILTVRHLAISLLLLIFIWQWSQAGIITSKAYLAKFLIAQAWRQTLITGEDTKPWPWADTWPVARLTFKDSSTFYVLAGSTGNSLAFGPGHLSNTALPGTRGASVIGGHRDTHFSVLENAKENDLIQVQNKAGLLSFYHIDKSWIANSESRQLSINPDEDSVYLITCYPFKTLRTGGHERFVVKASLEGDF